MLFSLSVVLGVAACAAPQASSPSTESEDREPAISRCVELWPRWQWARPLADGEGSLEELLSSESATLAWLGASWEQMERELAALSQGDDAEVVAFAERWVERPAALMEQRDEGLVLGEPWLAVAVSASCEAGRDAGAWVERAALSSRARLIGQDACDMRQLLCGLR